MENEIDFAKAIAELVCENNSGFSLKDAGVLLGALLTAGVAVLTIFFNNLSNKRENERHIKRDEVELKIKEEANRRENESYENLIENGKAEIEKEKNKMINEFNKKMNREQSSAVDYFKNLRSQYNEIVRETNKFLAKRAKVNSAASTEEAELYDCVARLQKFMDDKIHDLPTFYINDSK